MCVSAAPADFKGTMAYCGRIPHPHNRSKEVEVMMYQNSAVSHAGANALILHIPAMGAFGQENFIDFTPAPNILEDMVEAVRPRTRGMDMMMRGMVKGVSVFDVGIYTVVLSQKAELIDEALQTVPQHKRPFIDMDLLRFYETSFPRWSLAICCYNVDRWTQSQPIGVWYETMFPDQLRIPGIDAHTGTVPDLSEDVGVDHWLMYSLPGLSPLTRQRVSYRDNIPTELQKFLPNNVVGYKYGGTLRNGDFVLPVTYAREGEISEGMIRAQPHEVENIPFYAAG